MTPALWDTPTNTPMGIMNVKWGMAWVRFNTGMSSCSTRRRLAATTPSTPPIAAAMGTLTSTADRVIIVLSQRVSAPSLAGGSPMKLAYTMNPAPSRASFQPPNFQPATPNSPAITTHGRAGMFHGS